MKVVLAEDEADDANEHPASQPHLSVCDPDPPSTAPEPVLGAPRYVRGGELGRGAMGVVDAGFDPALARPIALKRTHDASSHARLLREARTLAALDHPCIPTVLDVVDDGGPVVVMPIRRGQSLAQRLQHGLAGELGPTLRALLAVAHAVVHAHARGILHRDISPNNVLVDDDGGAALVDWGLASEATDTSRRGGGTPGFTAPELEAGGPATPQSDVFSLGALLRFVLAASDGPPTQRRAATRPKHAPAPLWAIAVRATAPAPHARYEEATTFARDLAAFLDGQRVLAYAEPWHARLRRVARAHPRITRAVALVVALGTIGIAIAIAAVAAARDRADAAVALRLLSAAQQRLTADDLVGARQLLEAARATGSLDAHAKARAAGVAAAIATTDTAAPQLPQDPCASGVVVDLMDLAPERALCLGDDGALRARDGDVLVPAPGPERVQAQVAGACRLADGTIVLGTTASPRSTATHAGAPPLALDGGSATVRCSRGRRRATVVATTVGVIFGPRDAITTVPCGEAVSIVALLPMDGGDAAIAVCADGAVARIDAAGGVHRVTSPEGALPRRTTTRAALIDDATLALGTARGDLTVVRLDGTAAKDVELASTVPVESLAALAAVGPRPARMLLAHGERGSVVIDIDSGALRPVDDEVAAAWLRVPEAPVAPTRAGLFVGFDGRSALAVARGELLVGDGRGRVRALSPLTGRAELVHAGAARVIKSIAVSPDEHTFAIGGAGPDGLVVLRDRRPAPMSFADDTSVRARHVAFLNASPAGDPRLLWISYATAYGATIPRDASTAVERGAPLPGAPSPFDVPAVAAGPHAVWLLDRSGTVWAVTPDERIARRGQLAGARALAVAGSHLTVALTDAIVNAEHVGDELRLSAPIALGDAADPIDHVARFDDGDIAVCRRSGLVSLHAPSGAVRFTVQAHDERCGDLVVCEDQRAVCSAGWDGRVRVLSRP